MIPTLSRLDLLEVRPYEDRAVRAGDVIWFQAPDGDHAVVHRVIEVMPGGARTRGDNTPSADPWLVSRDRIAGRVVAAWRGSQRRIIAGAGVGRLVARVLRCRRALRAGAKRLLLPVWPALEKVGSRLGSLRTRTLVVRVHGRNELRLMLGRLDVGRSAGDLEGWQIRRIFRPFIIVPPVPTVPQPSPDRPQQQV